jgi:hypothetical protein
MATPPAPTSASVEAARIRAAQGQFDNSLDAVVRLVIEGNKIKSTRRESLQRGVTKLDEFIGKGQNDAFVKLADLNTTYGRALQAGNVQPIDKIKYLVQIMELQKDINVSLNKGNEQRLKTIISQAETAVTAGVIVAMALLNAVHRNRKALIAAFSIMTGGLLLLGVSTALRHSNVINGFWWLTLTGLGSYLAYVPFNAMLFERIMAATRATGTAVFAIYVSDAVGYTGSVGVQIFKDLARGSMTRLGFFEGFTWLLCVVGSVCLVGAGVYFLRSARDNESP